MSDKEFWSIVASAKEDEVALKNILTSSGNINLIVDFYTKFQEYCILAYREDVWFAAAIVNGGFCSDDGFIDFRYWLISKGERVYKEVLKNPDNIVRYVKEIIDYEYCNESYGYSAMYAYESLTGKDIRDLDIKYGYKRNKVDLNVWNSKDFRSKFPRLTKLAGKYNVWIY